MEEWLKYLGYVAGALTTGSLIPQVIKTFRTKEADDVSFTMYIIYLSSTILWIVYGFLKEDWSIIGANAIACLLNIGMVSMKIKYGK